MIKKILIVDDSPVARKIMKTCIPKDRGYELFEATNGREGVEQFQSVHPDLTFMDLTMPELDGYKATEEIINIDKNAMIVVATADVQPKSLARVMALGAFTVLKKPPRKQTLEDLIDKVEKQIEKKIQLGQLMNNGVTALFSEEEKDILQEVMNIAFGNATADLAEVIDIFVVLNVPEIQVMKINDLPVYFENNIHNYNKIWALDQKFWGDFSGSGFLIFPEKSGKALIELFGAGDFEEVESKPVDSLEKEILLEVGNILVGACVGKIADLLDTNVTYSPPVASQGESKDFSTLVEPFNSNQTAIIMKTVFEFENQHISGLLFLITNQDSIEWLKKSLYDYLESFDE